MKIWKNTFIIFNLLFCTFIVSGQNIYPHKTSECNKSLPLFYLDGGETKATPDTITEKQALKNIDEKAGLLKHVIYKFQILVDTLGGGSVLSHCENSKAHMDFILPFINSIKWNPAKNGELKIFSSVSYLVRYDKAGIIGYIKPFEPDYSNMYSDYKNPVIINKKYQYKNKCKHKYDFIVFNRQNSYLPHNMSLTSAIDKRDRLWYSTYQGLLMLKNDEISNLNLHNSPFPADAHIKQVVADRNGIIWFLYQNNIYNYNGSEWEKFDTSFTKMKVVRSINSSSTHDLIICGDNKIKTMSNSKIVSLNTELDQKIKNKRPYLCLPR